MTHLIDDELSIRELVARCMLAFDHGDEYAWLACWAPDAVFRVNGKVARTRDELSGLFRGAARPIHHMTADSVIDVHGDTATHECSLVVFEPSADGPRIRTHGHYSDRLVRTDDRWLFSYREMNPFRFVAQA